MVTRPYRLYVITLEGGRSHPRWAKFYVNLSDLGAIGPDFVGIQRVALLSSPSDAATVKRLASRGIRKKSDIVVEEVTTTTVVEDHRPYFDTIEMLVGRHEHPNVDLAKARAHIRAEFS